MIRIAVCDDEAYMLDDINKRLFEYMNLKGLDFKIELFSSGKALLQSSLSFNLLFLDIQMEEPDGLKTAKLLRNRGFKGIIIFVTVLKDYVFESFEVEAYDFLLKPLREDRFLHTMDRAVNTLKKRFDKTVLVRKGTDCRVISFDDIIYCEVMGRKTYLHTQKGETIDYYCKLEDLERTVDHRFFRCHRSYLVNLDQVRGLKDGYAILASGESIPVSRLREQRFMQSVLAQMKGRRV